MTTTLPPIALPGSQFGKIHHICASFSNDNEYQALLPFVKHGLECGDKAVHVVTWRLAMFSEDAMIDIMRTHPTVIVGGTLHPNPFLLPSAEFFPEYQQPCA